MEIEWTCERQIGNRLNNFTGSNENWGTPGSEKRTWGTRRLSILQLLVAWCYPLRVMTEKKSELNPSHSPNCC